MNFRPKQEILESFEECLLLYHDAISFSGAIDNSRFKFLESLMKITDKILNKKKKNIKENDINRLVRLIHKKLEDLYSGKINLSEYNDSIKKDPYLKTLIKELRLDFNAFYLNQSEFKSVRDENRGPQEHSIVLVNNSITAESVIRASRSAVLENQKRYEQSLSHYVKTMNEYGTDPRNGLNSLSAIGNELYKRVFGSIPNTELEIRIVSSSRNNPPYVKIRTKLRELINSISEPDKKDEMLINIYDLLIGISMSIDGMVDCNFCNRNIEIDKIVRANKVKKFLLKKCDLIFSPGYAKTDVQTWLSGFHFSNALHRLSWVEERIFYKILVENCSCQEIPKTRAKQIHNKLSDCKCESIKRELSTIYGHNRYAEAYRPVDSSNFDIKLHSMNIIRFLSNQQKHSLSRFESKLEEIISTSKEEQFELILRGLRVLIALYNKFNS